jgi:hypothetical protein
MDERQKENSTRGTAFAAVIAAVALLLVILAWGPGRVDHVEINAGPSGTPGSTAVNGPPPPAASPSEGTVGSAR